MEGTVQEFTKNQNGRTKVKIDGGWYNVGNDCDLSEATVRIGDRISFDSSSSDFKGKPVWWLNKYSKLAGQNGGMPQDFNPRPTTTPTGSLDEPKAIPAEHLPCISNTVAHAIGAGLIKDWADLGMCIRATANALKGQP
jgi:hypothetical protein